MLYIDDMISPLTACFEFFHKKKNFQKISMIDDQARDERNSKRYPYKKTK